jgi:hypothetical protein
MRRVGSYTRDDQLCDIKQNIEQSEWLEKMMTEREQGTCGNRRVLFGLVN